MDAIQSDIEKKIGEVRTDVLDISYGEIINLHEQKELIIQPEYQRLFRWTFPQRSRLIESILLGLPIPPVFTIENDDGVLELIDGLQRISSIIHFINHALLNEIEPLMLEGCDIIGSLNGVVFTDMPLTLRLKIKRSAIRMVIIKRQSNPMLKYEMFKRLNTGGALLAPQEIRNCSVRMFGESGVKFYDFLTACANSLDFKTCTESLAQEDLEQKHDEELVLRFFAAKNAGELFKNNIKDWLDNYLEEILTGKAKFDYSQEKKDFDRVFSYLSVLMGNAAFVRHRNGLPIGAVAPAYYEAISVGVFESLELLKTAVPASVKAAIIAKITSEDFRKHVGPGCNKKSSFRGRINAIKLAIGEASP